MDNKWGDLAVNNIKRTRRDIIQSVVTVAVAGAATSFSSSAVAALTENGKTWGISSHPHFDRVMAPWLVKRFVDKDAKFVFSEKVEQLPKGAISMGYPTGDLTAHDEAGSCFHKTIVKYKIDDPAVLILDKMNGQALTWSGMNRKNGDWKTQQLPVDMNDRYARWGFGLMGLADAYLQKAKSDQEALDLSFPVYDALYALITKELKDQKKG